MIPEAEAGGFLEQPGPFKQMAGLGEKTRIPLFLRCLRAAVIIAKIFGDKPRGTIEYFAEKQIQQKRDPFM